MTNRAAASVHLLTIDPQHDFCNPTGSLFVKGADADMQRLATMVTRLGNRLDDIHVTLDCHHMLDIAHPTFWRDQSGKMPQPFTVITYNDVKNGIWQTFAPMNTELNNWALYYVQQLEQGGRYPLCIWPPHCLIGSQGGTIVPDLFAAFNAWAQSNNGLINFVSKGSNFKTEHYSGVRAEVLDPEDPSTQMQTGQGSLLDVLMNEATLVAIAGEALSHCLANTVRDIANAFGNDDFIRKFVLLTDATSSVQGFEGLGTAFISEMTGRGMQLATTVDFLA